MPKHMRDAYVLCALLYITWKDLISVLCTYLIPCRPRFLSPTHATQLSLFEMGSVGDNYKCPLCGRVGHGGYAMDWVGYPTCDLCNFGQPRAALASEASQRGIADGLSPMQIRQRQLTTIGGKRGDTAFATFCHSGRPFAILCKFLLPSAGGTIDFVN